MKNEGYNQFEDRNAELLNKYDLVAGQKAEFEKISIHSPSSVKVGERSSGVLLSDVKIANPIHFSNTESVLSSINKVWEDNNTLYLETDTSVYKLLREKNHETNEQFGFDDIDYIETAKGSKYTYLPNGTTQRYKEAEKSLRDPKDVLVFIPDYDSIKKGLPQEVLNTFGTNGEFYIDTLLDYIHNKQMKVNIVNEAGKVVETNKAIIDDGGQIYITFGDKTKIDFRIPVSHLPKIGYSSFDKINTGNGWRRHLGNIVTKIVLK